MTDSPQIVGKPDGRFATTRWSLVISAGEQPTVHSRAALEKLCELYWYPLYVFVRRRGHTPEQAEDLIQGFFTRLIEKAHLARADSSRGRFRTYLLSVLEHYLSDEWDRERALKRGGGIPPLSISWEDADRRYKLEPATELNPRQSYERHWVTSLLDRVFAELREEYARDGRERLFDLLKDSMSGARGRVSYDEIRSALDMSESAVKIAAFRLRKRFGAMLRAEISDTVDDEAQITDEIRYLLSVVES